jgi:iron complex outermembrane receptor protein
MSFSELMTRGFEVNCVRGAGIIATAAGVPLLAILLSPSALAQQTPETQDGVALEEVVVTAGKQKENLQQTAIAVTAVSSEELANVSVENFSDIARVAPNIQVGQLVSNSVFIRGIGQQQPSIFDDPGVAIFVDGVYRPRFNFNSINFGDVEQLEVLHGPQGTLYGKNAVGGALNIVSNAPGNDLDGYLEGQAGSRDRERLDAALDVPIVQDTLLARVSFESNKQNGYISDIPLDQELGDTDYNTTKAALTWKAADNFDATLRADYTRQDSNGFGLKLLSAPAIAQQYLTSNFYSEYGTDPSYNIGNDGGIALTLDWSALGPGTLKVISAYRLFSQRIGGDLDGTPIEASSDPNIQHEHFISEEVDYSMSLLKGKLNWTFGVFYMDERDNYSEGATFELPPYSIPPILLSAASIHNQSAVSYAAFTQGTYALTDKLSVTAGVRYSEDQKDVYASLAIFGNPVYSAPNSGSWSATTPKFTLQYQVTTDLMTYATASEGFKSGGFNGAASSLSVFTAYKPEYLWNYEAGVKSEWFDHQLRLNVTGYFMNYTGIQENNQQNTPEGLVITLANAGDAHIKGAEGELAYKPTRSIEFNATFGINDFHYTSLGNVPGVTLGDVLPFSSKYTASGGGQYTISLAERGEITLRSDYSWLSKTFFDPQNTEQLAQGDYGLWSARVAYQPASKKWMVFA